MLEELPRMRKHYKQQRKERANTYPQESPTKGTELHYSDNLMLMFQFFACVAESGFTSYLLPDAKLKLCKSFLSPS